MANKHDSSNPPQLRSFSPLLTFALTLITTISLLTLYTLSPRLTPPPPTYYNYLPLPLDPAYPLNPLSISLCNTTTSTPCTSLGHPEICCPSTHTCQPTNLSLVGVYCCALTTRSCSDRNLFCPPTHFPCPASVRGGCCLWGSRCDITRCVSGDGPESTYAPDVDGDGLTGTEDLREGGVETTSAAGRVEGFWRVMVVAGVVNAGVLVGTVLGVWWGAEW